MEAREATLGTVTERPCARKDLVLQEVGHEGMLYDRAGERIHILNVTALTIWKACDGARDLDGLVREVAGRFSGIEGQDIRGDIEKLLNDFEERGLLEG